MNLFDDELTADLKRLRQADLLRSLRTVDSPQGPEIEVEGRRLINFSSNDYLGLANHPAIKEAAIRAINEFGAGSGASRLVCGSLKPHAELETALAKFNGVEAALTFSSGYAAAMGTIYALAGRDDVVMIDKRVHASLVDAARLCGAKLRVFAHNDLDGLERILKWADERHGTAGESGGAMPGRRPRTLIVTESVFSMDGDHAPLRGMVELKDRFGAWLMVDEAHATGVYGVNGRGLADELGIASRVDIHLGTLGKALGAAGGYIAGSRALVDVLVNRARSFIFSTAPAPAAAAAARAGVELVMSAEGRQRRELLWTRVGEFATGMGWAKHTDKELAESLFSTRAGEFRHSVIWPVIVGAEARAVEASERLRGLGLFVPGIRFPTVPRGEARLRLAFSAGHSREHVETLVQALTSLNLRPRRA